jgi:hypothetical protein
VPELSADPDAIAADGATILQAADQLRELRHGLTAPDFGEDAEAARHGHSSFVGRFRVGIHDMGEAADSLGSALRTAAELYRLTEDANMRRP